MGGLYKHWWIPLPPITSIMKELEGVQLCEVSVKEDNSKEKGETRATSKVHIHILKWKGHANFTVVQLDGFELILGKDFLRRAQTFLMPFVEKLVILERWKLCVVCTTIRIQMGKCSWCPH